MVRRSTPLEQQLPVAGYKICRDIPVGNREPVNLLAMVSQTDQLRSWPVAPEAPPGQRSVIKAATHAQAVALRIKANQRHQQELQTPERYLLPRVGNRLTDTKAVGMPAGVCGEALELHAPAGPASNYRQIAVFALASGFLQQSLWIDFTVIGQIESNVTAAQKKHAAAKQALQGAAGVTLLTRSKGAARFSQFTAK